MPNPNPEKAVVAAGEAISEKGKKAEATVVKVVEKEDKKWVADHIVGSDCLINNPF